MKVSALIALLQKEDPEAKAYMPGEEEGTLVLFDVAGITVSTSEILGNAVIINRED